MKRIAPRLNFNKYVFGLVALILLVVAANFIWLSNNQTPPTGNGLQDLLPGINFYLDLSRSKITPSDLVNFPILFLNSPGMMKDFLSAVHRYLQYKFFIYPPLAPLSYSLFYIFFPGGSGLELMANTVYLALALFAIYGIGKIIFSRKAGLLAAFILSSFMGVISISREPYSEFILMCLVTLTLYLLLLTDYFRSRKYSLLLGVSLGLVVLAKWEFLPTLLGPFALVLWRANALDKGRHAPPGRRGAFWLNFILAVLIGTVMSLWWYVSNFQSIFWRLFIRPEENLFSNNLSTFYPRLFSIQIFSYYPLAVINTHIGLFYFLCLVFIAVAWFRRIFKNRRIAAPGNDTFYVYFLISWIILPYLLFTLVKIHAPSHIMVILPALAIIISAGVFSLRNKMVRVILLLLVLVYGSLSHLHSFTFLGKGIERLFGTKIYIDRSCGKMSINALCLEWMRDCWQAQRYGRPNTGDWKIKETLRFIKEDSAGLKYRPLVLILGRSDDVITPMSFGYHNLLGNYQLYIAPRGNDSSAWPTDRTKFDYVVLLSSRGNTAAFSQDNIAASALEEAMSMTINISSVEGAGDLKRAFFTSYYLIKEYRLPDKTLIKIYRLKVKGGNG